MGMEDDTDGGDVGLENPATLRRITRWAQDEHPWKISRKIAKNEKKTQKLVKTPKGRTWHCRASALSYLGFFLEALHPQRRWKIWNIPGLNHHALHLRVFSRFLSFDTRAPLRTSFWDLSVLHQPEVKIKTIGQLLGRWSRTCWWQHIWIIYDANDCYCCYYLLLLISPWWFRWSSRELLNTFVLALSQRSPAQVNTCQHNSTISSWAFVWFRFWPPDKIWQTQTQILQWL